MKLLSYNDQNLIKLKNFLKKNNIICKLFNFFLNFLVSIHEKIKLLTNKTKFNSFFIYRVLAFITKKIHCEDEPLVSIIVPNFNHGTFLKERLNSIYYQSYSNFEVILLDDKSTDGSEKILKKFLSKHNKNTKLICNKINSGSPFMQWKRGILQAKGSIIWIAESDDYCDLNFLKSMVSKMKKNGASICFSKTIAFEDESKHKLWDNSSYSKDCDINWDIDFFMSSSEFIEKGFGWQNLIPNISCCIFNKIDFSKLFNDLSWNKMKLAGDWIFYLFFLKRCKKIFYDSSVINYHRFHSNNTSLKMDYSSLWIKEHIKVSNFMAENFNISKLVYINFLFMFNFHLFYKLKIDIDKNITRKLFCSKFVKITSFYLLVVDCFCKKYNFEFKTKRKNNLTLVVNINKEMGNYVFENSKFNEAINLNCKNKTLGDIIKLYKIRKLIVTKDSLKDEIFANLSKFENLKKIELIRKDNAKVFILEYEKSS